MVTSSCITPTISRSCRSRCPASACCPVHTSTVYPIHSNRVGNFLRGTITCRIHQVLLTSLNGYRLFFSFRFPLEVVTVSFITLGVITRCLLIVQPRAMGSGPLKRSQTVCPSLNRIRCSLSCHSVCELHSHQSTSVFSLAAMKQRAKHNSFMRIAPFMVTW